MKSIEAFRRLRAGVADVFETSDAAVLLGPAGGHASRVLERLCEAGQVVRLKRGLWAFPDRLDPLALPGYLAAPLPCYVSLQSALFHHGLISQVPDVIYAVSPARTRRWRTPPATVSIHHVSPHFFFGDERLPGGRVRMATPEKALLDCLYLSSARSRLFARLPELDLREGFDRDRARRLLDRLPSARRRATLLRRLETLSNAECGTRNDSSTALVDREGHAGPGRRCSSRQS